MVDVSVFECGVCIQTYNEGALKPLSLPCGHVFCQDCLIKQSRLDHIVCPIDAKRHEVSPYSLPCCFAILANLPTHKPKEVCCSRHPKRKIKFQCKSHEKYLCSECIIEHTGSGHNVVAFSINVSMIRQEINEIEESCEFKHDEIEDLLKNLDKAERNVKEFYEKEITKVSSEYESAIKILQQKKKDQTSALLKHLEDQERLVEKTKIKVIKVLEGSSRVKQEINSLREHLNGQSYEQFCNQIKLIKQEIKHIDCTEQIPELQYWSLKENLQLLGGGLTQLHLEEETTTLKENRYRYADETKSKGCHHTKITPKLALQNIHIAEPEITSITSRGQDEKTRQPSSTEKELFDISCFDKSERGKTTMADKPVNQVAMKQQIARTRHQRRNVIDI